MMKFWLLKLVFITMFFAPGCAKISESAEVMIRVKNLSDFDFDEVILYSDTLGFLPAQSVSPYFSKPQAFRYASVYVSVDTFRFGLTAIDYVGEKPLEPGNYTFNLNISALSASGVLTQTLVKD